MNHKNTENTCHIAGNMPFFETNHELAVLLHTENTIQLLKKCTYPYYNIKIKKYLAYDF